MSAVTDAVHAISAVNEQAAYPYIQIIVSTVRFLVSTYFIIIIIIWKNGQIHLRYLAWLVVKYSFPSGLRNLSNALPYVNACILLDLVCSIK
jgi:hypothetical protein